MAKDGAGRAAGTAACKTDTPAPAQTAMEAPAPAVAALAPHVWSRDDLAAGGVTPQLGVIGHKLAAPSLQQQLEHRVPACLDAQLRGLVAAQQLGPAVAAQHSSRAGLATGGAQQGLRPGLSGLRGCVSQLGCRSSRQMQGGASFRGPDLARCYCLSSRCYCLSSRKHPLVQARFSRCSWRLL